MTVKSVVDIEVNDESFEKFAKKFEAYKRAVDDTKGAWGSVLKDGKVIEGSFASMAALVLAQTDAIVHATKAKKEGVTADERSSSYWADMARNTRSVAGNIVRATESLLKWTALTSVFSGLLGAGGLFGIDRMAGAVGANRRSALGVGVTYGEQTAFETNYSRFVDSGSFLSSVNQALHDVTKRATLYGAGLSEGDIAGKDTAQVAALLLTRVKAIADRTPSSQLGQAYSARGIDQLMSLEDFQRLRSTSASELSGQGRNFKRDAGAFGLDPSAQLAWQNFYTQMNRAGITIENVFIKGLNPLIPALTHLSSSVADVISVFFETARQQHWVEKFGEGIEYVAHYIGTKDFRDNVKTFVEDVGIMASALHNAIQWMGQFFKPTAPHTSGVTSSDPWYVQGSEAVGLSLRGLEGSASSWWSAHPSASNPGNLRVPGRRTGYAAFGSSDDGLRAMARQLWRDRYKHGLTSLNQIIGDPTWGWAPAVDHNNVAAYVGDVSRRSGLNPNVPLDLNNPNIMARLIASMTKHENNRTNYTPAGVARILVQNNTGGNVVITASQLAPPHLTAAQLTASARINF